MTDTKSIADEITEEAFSEICNKVAEVFHDVIDQYSPTMALNVLAAVGGHVLSVCVEPDCFDEALGEVSGDIMTYAQQYAEEDNS